MSALKASIDQAGRRGRARRRVGAVESCHVAFAFNERWVERYSKQAISTTPTSCMRVAPADME